jgi:hypothetical protein
VSVYIERIAKRFGLEETRLPDSPMDAGFEVVESDFDVPPTEEMISMYHRLIGSIGYAATTVRFDVSYRLSVLSRFLTKSNEKLVNADKRIMDPITRRSHAGFVTFNNHGLVS